MPLIQVIGLKKDYTNEDVITPVLNGLNFIIDKGEFLSIMGPSGSGKSTLMHILGFLDTLTSGKYLFNGQDVGFLSDDQLAEMRGKKVGFIFQAFNLLPRVSALENVMLPMMYDGVPKDKREGIAKQLLTKVGLEHRLNNTPGQLSGGEKQRVAIARALINDPEIIFADEPTGNLDSKSGLQVMRILHSLHEQGHTVVLVTHERYTAEFGERIIQLKDGVIISDFKNDNGHKELDGMSELIK